MVIGKVFRRINHFCIPLKEEKDGLLFFYYYPDMEKQWKVQLIRTKINHLRYYDQIGTVETEVLTHATRKINARPQRAEGCQYLINYLNEQIRNDKKSNPFGRYSY